jgi:hypothetical protein
MTKQRKQQSKRDPAWLDASLKLLERCDAATCAPRWKESEGSRAEAD